MFGRKQRVRGELSGSRHISGTDRAGLDPLTSRFAPGTPHRGRLRATRRFAIALAVAALPVLALTAPAALAQTTGPATALLKAAPSAVPGPPSGWTTVFSDDFNGGAGSGADSQWMYDTGPGSNFGTGEIETMTNSTSNVHLDGNGESEHHRARLRQQLDLRPHPDDVRQRGGARRRPAGSHRLYPAAQPRQRARLLAGLLDARDRASGRKTARSTSWRTSTRCPRSPGPYTAGPTRAVRVTRRTGSAVACARAEAARPATTRTR